MNTYCEICDEFKDYEIVNEETECEFNGKTIKYDGKVARCSECGSEIYDEEVLDYNMKQMDHMYREMMDLIQIEEIYEILQKYNIGKRPLSVLLGWGEVTVTRFLDGMIPSKSYSDQLKQLLYGPKQMRRLLSENGRLISPVAKKKVQKVLAEMKSDLTSKLEVVTKYLIGKCVDITPLALQKLLYYVQGFHIVFQNEPMFEEECEAWVHGPVFRTVYFEYRDCGYRTILQDIDMNEIEKALTEREKELIDSIIGSFGCYSGSVLEAMTHSEIPWIETRNGLERDEKSDRPIDLALMGLCFNQLKEKYQMVSYLDIAEYSIDLFEKVKRPISFFK
jgi:putative zinc finger/helix-turn-helix YgiT family protein